MNEPIEPRTIQVSRADLDRAGETASLSSQQIDTLWQNLSARVAPTAGEARHEAPRFTFTHTLYYFGGMLAIGAATLFMTEGWRQLGAWGLLAICVAYAVVCVFGARKLDARALEIPAGILATLAVCLAPLATWALLQGLGAWPEGGPQRYQQYHTHIDWRWLALEAVSLVAAAVALWALRYPFLVMPVAVTLWYMSMDLARLVVAPGEALAWDFYRDFSMVFGLLMVLLAVWVDARSRLHPQGSKRDYAFWLYLLGFLTFWGALSSRHSDSEWSKFAYAMLNVGFILMGAVLQRRVFAVCGGLGVAMYLGYLSSRVFRDSLLFPLALTLIGLAVMACGVWWQRHEGRLHEALVRRLPRGLKGWVPAHRGGGAGSVEVSSMKP